MKLGIFFDGYGKRTISLFCNILVKPYFENPIEIGSCIWVDL